MSLLKTINKGLDVVDQLVVDEDLKNQLKYDLAKTVASGMLTGKGASITKITICGLIAFVVITVMLKWLLGQGFGDAVQLITVITPLLGMLTGSYAAGKTVQKVVERKYTNGSQSTTRGSRKVRPHIIRPGAEEYEEDERPSDTKRSQQEVSSSKRTIS